MPRPREERSRTAHRSVRILLDECVPWPLRRVLVGHECNTPSRMGWAGIKNGDLIRQAEEQFDVFVTSDQNLRSQQNLQARRIAIVELSTNDLRRIERSAAALCLVVANVRAGEFRRVEIE